MSDINNTIKENIKRIDEIKIMSDINTIKENIKRIEDLNKARAVKESADIEMGCFKQCMNNVVVEEKLKQIQNDTLGMLKNFLSKTYGPMGSYTEIVKGDTIKTISSDYSKDGLKVLKNIIFDSPLEMAMQSELCDICQFVVKQVGDGTTSAVILSSLIYSEMLKIKENTSLPPRRLVKEFQNVVEECKSIIAAAGRDITLDDIYKICMISTNGNEVVSNQIMSVYKEYGFNVNISVNISNDTDTKIRIYDGMTINVGYSDPAYINNIMAGTAEIHNPKIYAFQDPVDTPEMISFLERIVIDNIFKPLEDRDDMIPTVIIAPMISRDGSGLLTKLIQHMYDFDREKMNNQKPPILILTNIHGTDEAIASDIENLCGCKYIKKYINAEIQKHEQETGEAPTLETVHNFAGTAELVSADNNKTKFINPKSVIDEDGATDRLIAFLKSEIKKANEENEDILTVGRLKKRLNCLEANMIEFLVGGISVSDRDSLRDLVEDAVLNCASAAENGVGRAANFEGLSAIYKLYSECDPDNSIRYEIISAIFSAYYKAAEILYGSVISPEDIPNIIARSIQENKPFNVIDLFNAKDLSEVKASDDVLCSIRTDGVILDAISKIITMMVTSNQCLLQSTVINRY